MEIANSGTKPLKPEDRISLEDLVAMIVSRDTRPGDTARIATDRSRKRVLYAVQKGVIRYRGGELFLFQAHAWLKEKWPGVFDDLPTLWTGTISLPLIVTIVAPPPTYPETLDDAYAELLRLHNEVQELTAALRKIEPDAQAWRDFKRKNKAAAAKPRGRRTEEKNT